MSEEATELTEIKFEKGKIKSVLEVSNDHTLVKAMFITGTIREISESIEESRRLVDILKAMFQDY